ncbi:PREDICTED: uncharacterized protein LOC109116848 [Tarenaya hassleriana]|uniref:uncharacterized protein LOC109116848 n=1 Tax=Tarenaya hassleriana TaxID=28532 RepID=UPI0008FD0114|nr:PREDICTED: uncharacterized protein LOC109116848 [Tarenaya hassleriana]
MRDTARRYIKVQIDNGRKASFWCDAWTDLGPLIDFIGESGPRQLRIHRQATVCQAAPDGDWQLPPSRGDKMVQLQVSLTTVPPPRDARGEDRYVWRQRAGDYKPVFHSSSTRHQLRTQGDEVSWRNLVWFRGAIPRQSFLIWQALQGRLPTVDRLVSWGMHINTVCVLCNADQETHEHLFFKCPFNNQIWSSMVSLCWTSPLDTILNCSQWIEGSGNPKDRGQPTIVKLCTQVSVYELWRERNNRIFRGKSRTVDEIRIKIDRVMRDNLLSMKFSNRRNSTCRLLEHWYFFRQARSWR